MNKVLNKYKALPVQVRAAFWFLICSFMQKGIHVITTPIITRLMTTGEYGQYSVFDSWLKILTIFITLSLNSGVYGQGLIKFSEDRKVFVSSLQGLNLTLTAAWTVIYLLFRNYWNKLFTLTTVQMLCMLIMIWATAVFSFWSTEQRVEYKYRNFVLATLAVSFAKPVFGIIGIIYARDKVTAYILALVIVELIGYVGCFFVQMKRGKVFCSLHYWKYALIYNIPLIPHYLSQNVLNSADRIMIGDMVGKDKAGIYSLAYAISQIMLLFNIALMQTIAPWIYQKIKDRKGKDIAPIAYVTLIIVAVVNLVLILLAPEAVAIFAPKSYYEAIWIVPPVAMSVYFIYSYDLFAKFAFYYEKTIFIMAASVLGAVLNVALNFVCIKLFGYMAAGYTTLVCYMVYSVAHYIFMRKVCNEFCDGVQPYETKKLLFITILFMAAGFLLLITYNYSIIRYSIAAVTLILGVVFHKRIIELVKGIMALKSKKTTEDQKN